MLLSFQKTASEMTIWENRGRKQRKRIHLIYMKLPSVRSLLLLKLNIKVYLLFYYFYMILFHINETEIQIRMIHL